MDQRTLLRKADLALADLTTGGQLKPVNAKKFLRIMNLPSVVLRECVIAPIPSPEYPLDKAQFGTRILHKASPGVALDEASRGKPTTDKVTFNAQLFKAEIDLLDEVLEDNIEGEAFAQSILEMAAEQVGIDLEDNVINGDTASADMDLTPFNGMIKQATSNVHNALSGDPDAAVWKEVLKLLPNAFQRTKAQMRIYTSIDAEIEYRDTLMQRATVAGDKYIDQRDVPVVYGGIPLVPVAKFPEATALGVTTTQAILTHPKNCHVGVWRKLKMERDRDVRAGKDIIVLSMRVDMKYLHEPAVVKAINIKTSA